MGKELHLTPLPDRQNVREALDGEAVSQEPGEGVLLLTCGSSHGRGAHHGRSVTCQASPRGGPLLSLFSKYRLPSDTVNAADVGPGLQPLGGRKRAGLLVTPSVPELRDIKGGADRAGLQVLSSKSSSSGSGDVGGSHGRELPTARPWTQDSGLSVWESDSEWRFLVSATHGL